MRLVLEVKTGEKILGNSIRRGANYAQFANVVGMLESNRA